MLDIYTESVVIHRKNIGKLGVTALTPAKTKADLSLLYTPGVAEPCRIIAKDPSQAYDLTWKGRTIAVISDGSAVLGLGNIGPLAALPVMEGKALLMKEFGGIDAVPIVLDTQDPAKIIETVKQLAPTFAGINLEDISAPRCFQIEEVLQDIGIPVFHDDQHGTAIVVFAALQNAAKVVGKPFESLKVVVVGAGAAGMAITRMLLGVSCLAGSCQRLLNHPSVADVIAVDSKGALVPGRSHQNIYKQAIAGLSNRTQKSGSLAEVIVGADVVVGVSGPHNITPEMIHKMAPKAMVFAMANPVPEIMPSEALEAGAMIVASGRSDFANQINNVLAFPGIFRAVVHGRLKKLDLNMKYAAAQAIADLVPHPNAELIVPSPFEPKLAENVAQAILKSQSNS
ncbi:MAG TPA: NAD-dependent malic enzyme [Candidatus Pacebacteria bacterium]|nr:NAD-dependent malic enzyme [Candidatus Paceibacterota bacterium]